MTKRTLAVLLMLVPAVAYAAISTSFDRADVSGDYLPGAGLSSRYGRMAAAGDYLPGGGGGAGTSTATTTGRIVWTIFQRLRK